MALSANSIFLYTGPVNMDVFPDPDPWIKLHLLWNDLITEIIPTCMSAHIWIHQSILLVKLAKQLTMGGFQHFLRNFKEKLDRMTSENSWVIYPTHLIVHLMGQIVVIMILRELTRYPFPVAVIRNEKLTPLVFVTIYGRIVARWRHFRLYELERKRRRECSSFLMTGETR